MVSLLFSVLFHEMGHATALRAFGRKAFIELNFLGGVTRRSGGALAPAKEFVVTFMGPLFGIILVLFCSIMTKWVSNNDVRSFFFLFGVINLFWTIVNLLPILPLDGGRLLTILFEKMFTVYGTKISHLVSAFFAVAAALFLFVYSQIIIGSLFLLFAYENFRAFQMIKPSATLQAELRYLNEIEEAKRLMQQGERAKAAELLKSVQSALQKGALFFKVQELLAQNALEEGFPDEAYHSLDGIKKQLSRDGLILLQKTCYQSKRYEEALSIGRDLIREEPSHEAALTNSYAAAQLGRVDEVINWLHYLKSLKGANVLEIVAAAEFDPLRDDPKMMAFIQQQKTLRA